MVDLQLMPVNHEGLDISSHYPIHVVRAVYGIAYLSSTAFSNRFYCEAVLGPTRFAGRWCSMF